MAYNDRVGELVRVTLAATYTNNQVEETDYAFTPTVTGGGDSRAALGAGVYGALSAVLPPYLATTTNMFGWKVSVLNVKPPPAAVSSKTLVAGTDAANAALPTQARPLIRFRTDLGGRTGRGRSYMFTPSAGFLQGDNTVNPALVAVLQGFGAFLAAGITVGGTAWSFVILNRSAPPPPFTYGFTPVKTAEATNLFATQRRSGDTGRKNADPW